VVLYNPGGIMLHKKTDKYELEDYRLVVTNARLARRINNLLKYYPEDAAFTDSDEVLFKVSNQTYSSVCNELGIILND
jgi:hypothetical protein